MLSREHTQCLQACNEAATAALTCAMECLRDDSRAHMLRCISLDFEAADVCRLACASIARSDEHLSSVCSLCAAVCQACADECSKHEPAHCQDCAKACKRCAEVCRGMF